LLKHENINVNQQNKNGITALMLASQNGHQEIVQMLIENEKIEVNKFGLGTSTRVQI
jgi:serine/threonine-protein phosphatase 6 regulatory ankyrin repeat subunit B